MKIFTIVCMTFILFFNRCSSTTVTTRIPTAVGKLCIYPERKNGVLNESQKYFHYVYLKSGDILIQFTKQEKDCYYFTHLPVGKVFHLHSVGNVNIEGQRYKWKNDGWVTRGVYGKYSPDASEKMEIKANQINFFGNYKLIVDYSEDKIKLHAKWDVAGGRNSTSAIILDATYEIVKIK